MGENQPNESWKQRKQLLFEEKFSISLSVLLQFCRRLRVIKRSFSKTYTMEKNLESSEIFEGKKLVLDAFWNAKFPPMLMVWQNTDCCENSTSWKFSWFFFKKIFLFSKRQFQQVWRVKIFTVFALFFCFVFHNVGAKSSPQNGNFCTGVLPFACTFKNDVRSLSERTWKS